MDGRMDGWMDGWCHGKNGLSGGDATHWLTWLIVANVVGGWCPLCGLIVLLLLQCRFANEKTWALLEVMDEVAAAHDGATVAQVAVRWLLQRPAVQSVLIGPRTLVVGWLVGASQINHSLLWLLFVSQPYRHARRRCVAQHNESTTTMAALSWFVVCVCVCVCSCVCSCENPRQEPLSSCATASTLLTGSFRQKSSSPCANEVLSIFREFFHKCRYRL